MSKKPRIATGLSATLLLLAVLGGSLAATAQTTLYQRLGGYDAIAAVVDDFIPRLLSDPQLARFFGGHSKDSLGKIRQRLVEQICAAAGGPCVYTGRDMRTAHAGLGITGSDWDHGVQHLVAALDTFKVPEAEKTELLSVVSTLEEDIVEKP